MKEYFYLSKKEKDNILAKINSLLKKEPEIVFVYCHGTFLAKTKIGFRDIDIALYVKRISKKRVFQYQQKIADILEKELKYPVDIKVLNYAPFYFSNNVFRNGILLFSRDNSLLSDLIEETSRLAMANYNFSNQSLKDLVS